MKSIEYRTTWLDSDDDADLPEDSVRAALSLWIEKTSGADCITCHRMRGGAVGDDLGEAVVGSMAGLADWLIENWLAIHWDVLTPFPRTIVSTRAQSTVFPTIADAAEGWPVHSPFTSDSELADWHHRHVLGHASSDLALPSIVIVPEERHIVIEVSGLPALMDASVEFCFQDGTPLAPTQYILRKGAFSAATGSFVEEVITHAQRHKKFQEWGEWLRERWNHVCRQEKNPHIRLQTMLGTELAGKLQALEHKDEELGAVVRNMLMDLRSLRKRGEFEALVDIVADNLRAIVSVNPIWKKVDPVDSVGMPFYEQGYRQARQVRTLLNMGDDPILDLPEFLEKLGVSLARPVATDTFLTAACAKADGGARIIRSSEGKKMRQLASSRFALAAALGRLVYSGTTTPDRVVSAAHGDYAQISHTQRANAFAAELLLPQQTIRALTRGQTNQEVIEELASGYGLSYSATRWHARNAGVAV